MNMRKHIFLNTMINIFHNVADQFIYIQTAKFHLSFVFRILTVSSVYSKFKSLRWRTLCKFHIRFKLTCVLYIYDSKAGPSSCAVWGVGLRSFACLGGGFESHWEHGCLSLVCVACCQVEVSALVWSHVQRSPTECGVSNCDLEATTVWRPWPTRRCFAIEIKIMNLILEQKWFNRSSDLAMGCITDGSWFHCL